MEEEGAVEALDQSLKKFERLYLGVSAEVVRPMGIWIENVAADVGIIEA